MSIMSFIHHFVRTSLKCTPGISPIHLASHRPKVQKRQAKRKRPHQEHAYRIPNPATPAATAPTNPTHAATVGLAAPLPDSVPK